MILVLALASALTAQEFDGDAVDCRRAGTTIEMNLCWGWYSDQEDERMQNYLSAAQNAPEGQSAALDGSPSREAPYIAASQPAWEAYREIWCQGVYEAFGAGSARNLAYLECKIDLAFDRTRTIWRDYLSSSAETDPSALPEPLQTVGSEWLAREDPRGGE